MALAGARCLRCVAPRTSPLCLSPALHAPSSPLASHLPGAAAAGRRHVNLSSTDYDPVGLVKNGPKPERDAVRIEALKLYRDAVRIAKTFTWEDHDGVVWRDKLMASVRKEYEQARHERDPEIITRLIIVGNQTLENVVDRMTARAQELAKQEMDAKDPRARNRNPRGSAAPGASSKYLKHEDMMKKEFMYRHQKWENRQNLEGDAWRKQFQQDQVSTLVGGPPPQPPPHPRNRHLVTPDGKIELKWRGSKKP
mmetsp:Transcript_998/g.2315  ORF Transcript_998/g.2315 Transcript_998/m.2315 type:complete len:253 (+) Transcript_998:237-995(+)